MGYGEWIALIGLILFWVGTLVTFWIQIKIKLTELDLKIKNLDAKIDEHVRWGELEQAKNVNKFNAINSEIKDNYKDLVIKIDVLIEKFSTFQIYAEKNFRK